MNRQTGSIMLASALLCLTAAMAQSLGPGAFELSWNSIDSGGGTSSGGSLEVSGTIGQPDAGPALAGGTFELLGGFWAFGGPVQPACPADVNGDGVVNITDLLAVIAGWGQTGNHPADVTGDGVVNLADLLAVISAWGMCS